MFEAKREAPSARAFLDVEESVCGKRWRARLDDDRLALALAQRLDLPEIIGRILAARGVGPEEAGRFLEPRLRDHLPDPSSFLDLDRAVDRLAAALQAGERIAAFADYDVDGGTSAALLQLFFRAIGRELMVYVPDRLAEGYGPNAPAFRRLKGQGASLVLTLDCGTTAHVALEAAAEDGLDVIVVDHHAAEARLPPAVAVVNPQRLDQTTDCGPLAAVGVTFLLLIGLNRALRDGGWYARQGIPEPRLMDWLDLVALGTVCDVVPLTGLNRALVAQGLKVLGRRRNPGLTALCDVAGVDEAPGVYHAGFLLGPRINAGGRVGRAGLGASLLACPDREEALAMARELDGYNSERREIEQAILEQAIAQVEAQAPAPDALVFAAGEGWHPGVIGIVASRLRERYNLPAVVVALEAGRGKGSGRSVPGLDLGAMILAARQAGHLIDGGGHPQAAGLTVAETELEALRGFLEGRSRTRLEAIGYRPSLGIDGTLRPAAATTGLLDQLERVAPFGPGNEEPRFVLADARVRQARVVGEDHVRFDLTAAEGGRLKAIAFRALDRPLGFALLNSRGMPLHIAGKLRRDRWRGNDSVQLIVEDAAEASG
ncbi:MAG: single-stranded-DNA-specific exonuclease RecJ [Kiloniellales bacterium]|nr:single-stranded-DNA-specific exonuclease RecJ [Kiloniellales bacterium]